MTQLSLLTVPADAWMVALVETSLRISVVLLAAGGIAMVLRRSSANLRHLVWALALAGALLVPVGASYLPAVNLPVRLPWLALGGVAAADRAQRVWEISSAMSAGVTLGDTEDAEGLPVRPAGVVTPPNASAASGRALPSVAGAASPGSGVPQPDSRRTAVVPSWSQLLAGVWIAGVVVLLLRIGLGMVATRRLGRRAVPPQDSEWPKLAAELGRRIGLTRPVRVLSSTRMVVPMTWGWLRPVVLVPETGDGWSAARKRVVLLHELNHVKRRDCAWQLVAQVACAVYWFNPLVWLGGRALRIERERACDEAVVRDGTQASSYADHLLEIARAHQDTGWSSLAAVAMARRSQLEGRLLSILDAGQRRRPSRRTALVLGTVMGAVILILTSVTPTLRAVAPVQGKVTTLTATTAAVSLEGGENPAPTAFEVATVSQEPVPTSQTPTVQGDQVAREVAQELRAAFEAQAEVQATRRRFADDQVRRELELRREALALVRLSQDSAPREQVERVEVELRELERRLEQVRVRTDLRLDEQELERVIERAQRAADRALARVDLERFDGVRIAEELLERLNVVVNLTGLEGLGRAARRPLDPRVVDLFLESLRDDDAEVGERAAWGLGRNRVEAGVEPLSNSLRDEDPQVRERAAWALGMIRSPTAVPGLGAALDDGELKVRVEVVEALGRIRDASAVEALVGALGDGEPRVRREAAEALGRIRAAGAVDGLLAALSDAEPAVVEHAVEALGLIRDPRAVDGLVGALQHQDPDVVEEAAEALGRIRSDEAIDGLIAALRDADGEVAEEIVEALGRIGGDRALDALIDMTEDASPAVRKAVIEALSGRSWSGPNPNPNPNPNPGPQ